MKTAFAETICNLRKERMISQRKAAEDLGVSQALLSHYENGVREPRLPFVKEIARYYGVSVDYILSGQVLDNAAEQVCASIERVLKLAQEKGGETLTAAAVKYLNAGTDNLEAILENPNRPYEPKYEMDIKTAEHDLVTAARSIGETL